MSELFQNIIDRWNGYTQADVDSLIAKMRSPEARRSDGIISLSHGEFRALVGLNRPFRPLPATPIGEAK
jgi:hypothetical protein